MISSLRALIIEDDPSWQQLLGEILHDQGIQVDVAGTLEAAVAAMRAAPHRLAVVDLSLGGADHRNADGLQVLDALRRHDPGCVALLLSGYATVEIAVSALTEHGAFTCLRKESFRRSQFRQIMQQALSRAHPSGGNESSGQAETTTALPVMPVAAATPQQPANQPGPPPADTRPAVLVVEDDAGWSSILSELLHETGFRAEVCRSYGEALGLLRRSSYRLALVDLMLANSQAPDDNSDGLRLLAVLQKSSLPAIVISGSALPRHAEQAFDEYGIVAFLEKRAFDRAGFRRSVLQALDLAQQADNELTGREHEVLALLQKGLTNKEIAEALVISGNTVKRHLKAIFSKLGVNTRAAAVAKGIQLEQIRR